MPMYGQDLALTVNCFAHMHNVVFPGLNPAYFP